jgi:hypothetical protein
MQVLCTSANGNAETYCCICGQGFVMFWERQSRRERAAAIREIQDSLRQHHRELFRTGTRLLQRGIRSGGPGLCAELGALGFTCWTW